MANGDWLRAGEHVIVTGGSSGIGFALADELAGRGAVVSLLARGQQGLDAAAERLRSRSAQVHVRSVDVSDADQVRTVVKDLEAEAGPCVALITAAGQARAGHFLQMPDDVFRTMMDVDYFGTLWAVRAVAPGMVERRRGTVLTVVSTAGLAGVFGYTAYGSAKFAVRGLTESLRSELLPYDVRVSAVFPPDVDTPGLAEENRHKPAETEAITGSIKPLAPQDVARDILRGLDRGKPLIFLDGTTRALASVGGAIGPVLRWYMDGKVRSARKVSARSTE